MANENFQYWKELVGLENTDFPQMIDLKDEDIERATIVPTRLVPIRSALAANNLISVQVQPGWGATTLYRYLKHELHKDSLTLLVNYDFEVNPLQEDMTEEYYIFRTKWLMARNLLRMFRDKPMQPLYMYEVIGFEDDGTSPWQGHLRRKMRELDNSEDNPEKFYELLPFFKRMPVDVCINYFLYNFQIRTVFLYLFPRKVNEDALYTLVGMIKSIYDGKKIAAAAMREVYISTPKVFKRLKETYARPYQIIDYQRYSAAEIYRMLVSTYPIEDSAQSISDVFSPEFLDAAYDKKLDLKKIMAKVEKDIVVSLPEDTSAIPYRLEYKKEGAE